MADRRLNLVLVEDDVVDVMILKRAILSEGVDAKLFVASDGIEALALLRSGVVPPTRRLILLDLNLPRMSGLEMLRELRQDHALHTTPVVVLTTSGEESDRTAAYDLHVAGYLIKRTAVTGFADTVGALNNYWTMSEMPS